MKSKHTIEERAAALSFIVWAAVIIFIIIAYLVTGCTHKGIDYTLESQLCTGQYQQKGACSTLTLAPSAYKESGE